MSHTFPEIINVRFGKHAHKVFLAFGLMTNTIVTAMLVLGGGCRRKFAYGCKHLHRCLFDSSRCNHLYLLWWTQGDIFCRLSKHGLHLWSILIFVTAIYFVSPDIGGISGMFEKLNKLTISKPVEGNSGGAYLTMALYWSVNFWCY